MTAEFTALREEESLRVVSVGPGSLNRDEARGLVDLFCSRLLLVKSLQETGQLLFRGRTDYLEAIVDDWRSENGPYSLAQRVSIAMFQGLGQPSDRARALVRGHSGDVPFVGTGVLAPEAAPALVADSLVTRLFEMTPDPWGLEAAARTFEAQERAILGDQARTWHELLAEARADRPLHGVPVVDPDARAGGRLAAVIVAQAEIGPIDARIFEGLLGFVDDPILAVVARARLASAFVLADPTNIGLPLPDLRQVVRVGKALSKGQASFREDHRTEFKSAFEWNSRTSARDPALRFGCLRTVVAFLNSEGGDLWIGVSDDGRAVGINGELAKLGSPKPKDVFEGKLREALKNSIDPIPLGHVAIEFSERDGRTVCQVTVKPRGGVTYLIARDPQGRLIEEIAVRDGNRTICLTGRSRDQFVLGRQG